MPKIPDFSELTKKFDGIFDSVKSAVGGMNAPAKAPEGDEIAAKFVEVINLAQSLAVTHAEQAKAIAAIHTKLGALYKDIQALKAAESAAIVTTTTVVEEIVQQDSVGTKKDETDKDK